jgi:hypothetical protein
MHQPDVHLPRLIERERGLDHGLFDHEQRDQTDVIARRA